MKDCSLLQKCAKYGMNCKGRNYENCDFYKRLKTEKEKTNP